MKPKKNTLYLWYNGHLVPVPANNVLYTETQTITVNAGATQVHADPLLAGMPEVGGRRVVDALTAFAKRYAKIIEARRERQSAFDAIATSVGLQPAAWSIPDGTRAGRLMGGYQPTGDGKPGRPPRGGSGVARKPPAYHITIMPPDTSLAGNGPGVRMVGAKNKKRSKS